MASYTFPFDTCEAPVAGPAAQPVSAAINLLTCSVVLWYLRKARRAGARVLLATILAFEAFHALSHAVHIPGRVQVDIAHVLAYAVNAALLGALWDASGRAPGRAFVLWMAVATAADLYALARLPTLCYIFTQVAFFLSILWYYKANLPERARRSARRSAPAVAGLAVLVLALLANESHNCGAMLALWPGAPLHAVVELAGLALFWQLSAGLYIL